MAGGRIRQGMGANNSKYDFVILIQDYFLDSEVGHGSKDQECIHVFEVPKMWMR
jgi:hypothetical protein